MWNGFVAMALPKQEGKFFLLQLVCGNAIAENGRKKKIVVAEIWEVIKKKSATSTIFLQQITCDQLLIISSNLNLTLRLLF